MQSVLLHSEEVLFSFADKHQIYKLKSSQSLPSAAQEELYYVKAKDDPSKTAPFTKEEIQELCAIRGDRILVASSYVDAGNRFLPTIKAVKLGDGTCVGLLVFLHSKDWLEKMIRKMEFGSNAKVIILGTNGKVKFHYPAADKVIGENFKDRSKLFKLIEEKEYGTYIGKSALVGGQDNVVGFHYNSRFDYVILVAQPMADLMSNWKRNAMIRIVVLALALILLFGFATYLQNVLRRTRESDALLRRKSHIETQGSKLDELGRLASGMCHDLNNILTSIIWCLERLKSYVSTESEEYNDLNEVSGAANRARQISKQILQKASRVRGEDTVFAINELVKDLGTYLRAISTSDIDVQVIAAERLMVFGDCPELYRVLLQMASFLLEQIQAGGGNLLLQVSRRGNLDQVVVEISALPEAHSFSSIAEMKVPEAKDLLSAMGGKISISPYRAVVHLPLYKEQASHLSLG